jgi:hypothetical protein
LLDVLGSGRNHRVHVGAVFEQQLRGVVVSAACREREREGERAGW